YKVDALFGLILQLIGNLQVCKKTAKVGCRRRRSISIAFSYSAAKFGEVWHTSLVAKYELTIIKIKHSN
ncbi:MAG: hypothetical protein ACKVJE_22700, partial [Pseudomonadales bacterium]